MVVYTSNPSYLTDGDRKTAVQAWLEQKLKILSEKQTKKQRDWVAAQVVDCLLF
jgi:hypothetical protein